MLMIICGLILFLYLVSIPIRIKVKGSLGSDDGLAEVSFSVFYVRVFKAKGLWKFSDPLEGDIVLLGKKQEQKIHVDMKKSPKEVLRMIRSIDLSLIGNLDVKTVELRLHYGNSDAFLTMAALATARIVFYSAMAALKSNQNVEIAEEYLPLYNERALKLDFSSIFSLSVADIIYGYIVGRISRLKKQFVAFRTKRRQKREERRGLVYRQ